MSNNRERNFAALDPNLWLEWQLKHPRGPRYSKEYVRKLQKGYVVGLLNVEDPSDDLIEVKRLSIQIKRELRCAS